ncbi:hypothetical protein G6F56_000732 [Rhizopus delemar]|uniref:Uncharacterized protein n=1 Tax=Rhizopus stolonifer TaxID=4846 RepID=A0A367KVV6_RHIST|nr:hypothetical protein G6F56_000732 [Rhizopus delemar]RCI06287.1 hypothetical protein CU098_013752 [Rhizopus stolonifer]
MNNKRSRSPSIADDSEKRPRTDQNNLLTELTQVLNQINSTPSSGEISAELIETFKILLLEIEELSADESNLEAKLMKHESDRCLESWFDDLLERCGDELDWDDLALAFALEEEEEEEGEQRGEENEEEEEDEDEEEEEEEIIIVDDEDTPVQRLAVS